MRCNLKFRGKPTSCRMLIVCRGLTAAHNSFARSDPFEHTRDPDDDREKEDAYHFISYVPIDGELYELDGLKRTPISHGRIDGDPESDWTDRARQVIEARIKSYGGNEVMFNLMAICADQVDTLQRRITAIQHTQGSAASGDTGTDLAGDMRVELIDLQGRLQEELEKRQRWTFENTLRRHNHLGLVHALLVALAKDGMLKEATEDARKAMKDRQEKASHRKQLQGM